MGMSKVFEIFVSVRIHTWHVCPSWPLSYSLIIISISMRWRKELFSTLHMCTMTISCGKSSYRFLQKKGLRFGLEFRTACYAACWRKMARELMWWCDVRTKKILFKSASHTYGNLHSSSTTTKNDHHSDQPYIIAWLFQSLSSSFALGRYCKGLMHSPPFRKQTTLWGPSLNPKQY